MAKKKKKKKHELKCEDCGWLFPAQITVTGEGEGTPPKALVLFWTCPVCDSTYRAEMSHCETSPAANARWN